MEFKHGCSGLFKASNFCFKFGPKTHNGFLELDLHNSKLAGYQAIFRLLKFATSRNLQERVNTVGKGYVYEYEAASLLYNKTIFF